MSQVEKDQRTGARLKMRAVLENAKAAGFQPGSIIDVGFALGTNDLHNAFENVRRLIIEPVVEAEPVMKRFCEQHPGSVYVAAAASDKPGVLGMAIKPGITGSSFHGKVRPGFAEKRMIPTVTLDDLVVEHDLPGPILLKMDVEGHELHVLRGALKECLPRTEMIICEVGTWHDGQTRGRPTIMDVFRFMEDHGFVFYEIIDPAYRAIDGALYMFDAVFVRADSPLRQVKSNRNPEQAEQVRKNKEARAAATLTKAG